MVFHLIIAEEFRKRPEIGVIPAGCKIFIFFVRYVSVPQLDRSGAVLSGMELYGNDRNFRFAVKIPLLHYLPIRFKFKIFTGYTATPQRKFTTGFCAHYSFF